MFCYGSYERAFLKRMRKLAKSKEQVDRVLSALVNVLSLVYTHVYFPCYSNGLKDVGNYLGCRWAEPDASGIQSIVWRRTWENTGGGEWKQLLLAYNLEDCAALKTVTAFLYTLQRQNILCENQDGEGSKVPEIAMVEDIKPPSTRRTWCKAEYSSRSSPRSTTAPTSTTKGTKSTSVPVGSSPASRVGGRRRKEAAATPGQRSGRIHDRRVPPLRGEATPPERWQGSQEAAVRSDLLAGGHSQTCRRVRGPNLPLRRVRHTVVPRQVPKCCQIPARAEELGGLRAGRTPGELREDRHGSGGLLRTTRD